MADRCRTHRASSCKRCETSTATAQDVLDSVTELLDEMIEYLENDVLTRGAEYAYDRGRLAAYETVRDTIG